MLSDDSFNFFRINLLAADIYHAFLAADEIIAIASLLNQIAAINKTVEARKLAADITRRGARRADMQRAVKDPRLCPAIRLFDHCRGKTGLAVTHIESDASFGRREGMGNAGIRIDAMEVVQYRLIDNLAREAHIFGRNRIG